MKISWSPTAWCDGQLVPLTGVVVPALSLGAAYGLGLFETLRAYRGRPFALALHLDRLARSAAELGLSCPWLAEPSTIDHAVHAVLMANGLRDAAVRITLTAEGTSLDEPAASLLITARAFDGYPREWYDRGVSLAVAPWRRCPDDLHVAHKSANYLTCLFARSWARENGADEALLLNCHGRVAEGSVSNVFAVDGAGVVVTPPVSEGLLPGVTRAIVIDLLRQAGVAVDERPLSLDELKSGREAFITNSLMEIVPIREVDGQRIANCPGEVTALAMREYRRLLEEAT